MSAVAVTTRMYCDGMPGGDVPGGNCGVNFDHPAGADEAREEAARRGWLTKGLDSWSDFCPTCRRQVELTGGTRR